MRRFCQTLAIGVAFLCAGSAAHARGLADMSGAEIKALQQRLADGRCYQGAIDGQASPALQAAINACPSQDPELRIETGMHVAPIKRIAVDQACRIAVTGSDDKTARVWSLPQARLLHTLRVPIGPGNGGKIYAVAISPDGHWIAAAGWDAQVQVNHQNFVYIFEAATGAMVSRVGPFGNVLNNLTFRPTASGWRLTVARTLASRLSTRKRGRLRSRTRTTPATAMAPPSRRTVVCTPSRSMARSGNTDRAGIQEVA